MDNIVERIITILNNVNLNIEDVSIDFITKNNVDSITFIEIIIYIEEEFDILVPDEYLLTEKLNTVSKIEFLVQELTVCIE